MILSCEKQKTLVTILIETGKYTFTGLVIGYFALQPSFSPWIAFIGGVFTVMCYVGAVIAAN